MRSNPARMPTMRSRCRVTKRSMGRLRLLRWPNTSSSERPWSVRRFYERADHRLLWLRPSPRWVSVSLWLISSVSSSNSVSSSDNLGERVTQPIEEPVAREEQHDRKAAEREEPLPVAQRSVEEQDLLIRHGEVRERVQVVQPSEPLHVGLEPGIDDRRREEPQHQHVRQDVANVAEVHGQGGEHERERRRA